MKVNCRACDICGEELGGRDLQYWLRKPIIRWGVPSLGMPRIRDENRLESEQRVVI